MDIFLFLVSFLFFFLIIKQIRFKFNFYKILLLFLAILGWLAAGSLVYFIGKNFFVNSKYWSIIIWPILEEIAKFLVIYSILINFKDLTRYSWKFWAVFWWLVWLTFSIYENLVYIQSGLDIELLIYRIFIVWGLIHMLLWMIYWYLIYKSFFIHRYFPNVFKLYKRKFTKLTDFPSLIKFIYYNSKRSIKTILQFFLKIFVLDVTIDYLLKGKKESFYWHSPVEIVVETFVLGTFLHIYYNFSLSMLSLKDFSIDYFIFYLVFTFWLLSIIYRIFRNHKIYFVILVMIVLMPIISFFSNLLDYKNWLINLILVYFILIYFFVSLIYKLEYL